jgi:hypothetical protein
MHDVAKRDQVVKSDELVRSLRGSIHLLCRVIPLLFEDKDLLLRSMWAEQAIFGNQVNALKLMESISLLLFKPGFTILELPSEATLMQYWCKSFFIL